VSRSIGVYKKEPNDAELPHLGLGESQMRVQSYKTEFGDTAPSHLPLHSESAAMLAMTSTILGPRLERLAPLMDGWESEMTRAAYETREDVQGEIRSIDFADECGMAYVAGGSIWGGAALNVNALLDDDKFQLGELALEVARYARRKDIGWQLWQCLTSTNPWDDNRIPLDATRRYPPSQPYRPDKPDWQLSPTPTGVKAANCFGHEPFFEWLYERIVEAIDAGKFSQWMADGDFVGGGGTVKPIHCSASHHSHLPGDSNYACQRNVIEMARRLRDRYPDLHIFWERPAMDLGVWMMRHANCSFTVDEYAKPVGLPGVGAQPINFIIGDKIRTWSRLRVQMQFLPHYLDQPLAFTEPKSKCREGYGWESAGVDYVMLSALACSPNQLYYLPSKTGIPNRDKLTIRTWLDWGRRNIRYLMVRKDLPDWPGAGKVDGFAHVIRDCGFIFLFNPNPRTLAGSFHLDQSIGLTKGQKYTVSSLHPRKVAKNALPRGEEITWEVPAQTAVLLQINFP
jgi:hypothetical protein